MSVLKPGQEYLPENSHPVNQVAKQWLLTAGVEPQAQPMYCLQLMLWGLDQWKQLPNLPRQERVREECLREQVEDLADWENQAAGLRFQLRHLDEDGADAGADNADLVSARELQQAQDPESAAGILLGNFQDQLSSHDPMWLHRPFLT